MAGFHLQCRQLDPSCVSIFSSSYPIVASSIFSNQSNNIVLGLPQPFFPWVCPANVVFNNESCLKMWPIHLFCRILRMSITYLSASTICYTSSLVLCSVHDTFIVHLHIHIFSSRQISSFCRVLVSLLKGNSRHNQLKLFHAVMSMLSDMELTQLGNVDWRQNFQLCNVCTLLLNHFTAFYLQLLALLTEIMCKYITLFFLNADLKLFYSIRLSLNTDPTYSLLSYDRMVL